jgi:hypothetical protein
MPLRLLQSQKTDVSNRIKIENHVVIGSDIWSVDSCLECLMGISADQRISTNQGIRLSDDQEISDGSRIC